MDSNSSLMHEASRSLSVGKREASLERKKSRQAMYKWIGNSRLIVRILAVEWSGFLYIAVKSHSSEFNHDFP